MSIILSKPYSIWLTLFLSNLFLDLNANRKLQSRSASAHQLTSPGSLLETSGKLKFPRTFSAAATETLKQNDDGFDIDHFTEIDKDVEVTSGRKRVQVLKFKGNDL